MTKEYFKKKNGFITFWNQIHIYVQLQLLFQIDSTTPSRSSMHVSQLCAIIDPYQFAVSMCNFTGNNLRWLWWSGWGWHGHDILPDAKLIHLCLYANHHGSKFVPRFTRRPYRPLNDFAKSISVIFAGGFDFAKSTSGVEAVPASLSSSKRNHVGGAERRHCLCLFCLPSR